MKTIIHVNQHVIKKNRKEKTNDPVLTVKTYKSNTYANEVVIKGESKVVYSPNKPLSCGAHVWIETENPVEIKEINNEEKSNQEIPVDDPSSDRGFKQTT